MWQKYQIKMLYLNKHIFIIYSMFLKKILKKNVFSENPRPFKILIIFQNTNKP